MSRSIYKLDVYLFLKIIFNSFYKSKIIDLYFWQDLSILIKKKQKSYGVIKG